MRVDLFDYELPPERIAQRPLEDRSASRLLVLDRETRTRTHAAFLDLARHLPPRALLVLNETAVIPARLVGRKAETGGRVEILLLERIGFPHEPMSEAAPGEPSWGRWIALVTASKRIRPGTRIELSGPFATVDKPGGQEGFWEISLEASAENPGEGIERGLARIGAAPLPPYIRRDDGPDAGDQSRYQTVFARRPGAVAAPTAGLHFSPEVLDGLAASGFEIARLTLHVGAGTFLPVRVGETEEHRMHVEHYEIPGGTAAAVARARAQGRPIVAIGTTTLRALESAARPDGTVAEGTGATDLFITPGYRFRMVDALFTNFHTPRSTLLMLVAAFAGLEPLREAYADALANGYRFLSYGDAMLVK